MSTDPLPLTADGPTSVLDVDALLDQIEQEDEEREFFADLFGHPTPSESTPAGQIKI